MIRKLKHSSAEPTNHVDKTFAPIWWLNWIIISQWRHYHASLTAAKPRFCLRTRWAKFFHDSEGNLLVKCLYGYDDEILKCMYYRRCRARRKAHTSDPNRIFNLLYITFTARKKCNQINFITERNNSRWWQHSNNQDLRGPSQSPRREKLFATLREYVWKQES